VKRYPYSDEVVAAQEVLLTPEEAKTRLAMAMRELDGPELENLHALIDWFQRCYPTALDRLRYLRRKNAEAFERAADPTPRPAHE
jgi:hypothetical protein